MESAEVISAAQLSGVFETIIMLLAVAAFCFCAGYYIRDIADAIRRRIINRRERIDNENTCDHRP